MSCSIARLALALLLPAAAAHAATVRITQADGEHVQVQVHPGDILRVDLSSEPAGGRTWSLAGRTPVQLLTLGAAQRVFGGRMSDQGVSSFAWRALNDGGGDLIFAYGKGSGRGDRPEKSFAIHFDIDGEPLGPEEAHPSPISPVELFATYSRVSPCGDCRGIRERLLLYKSPKESTYVLRRSYQDAPSGTLTSVSTGNWAIRPGNTADPSATIYELLGTSETLLYRSEEDRLVPIDAQMIPIPAPHGMDTSFHKAAVR